MSDVGNNKDKAQEKFNKYKKLREELINHRLPVEQYDTNYSIHTAEIKNGSRENVKGNLDASSYLSISFDREKTISIPANNTNVETLENFNDNYKDEDNKGEQGASKE